MPKKGEEDMEKRGNKFENSWILLLCITIFLSVFVNPCIGAEDPAKFPSRPITMVIQWAAGGGTDLAGRKLADLASKILGQPIVVVNKVGGAGITGLSAIAQADPDGYTVGAVTYSAAVIVPHLREVPYKVKEDFTWVMQFGRYNDTFFVLGDSPWKTFKDFIEDARKNPGKLKYAPPGPQGAEHIFMEWLFAKEKVKVTFVPASGGEVEAGRLLLGGHVEAAITTQLLGQIGTGRVRALMGVQAENRLEAFPDIPTHYEMGYQFDTPNWIGVNAPKGLDPNILKKLYDAFKQASEDPSFKELLDTLFVTKVFRDSDSFKEKVFKDFDNQAKILKEIGFIK